MQLPCLIREILDYYRYTIPQRERMKRLKEEYNKTVIRDKYCDRVLVWKRSNLTISDHSANENRNGYYSSYRNAVFSFRKRSDHDLFGQMETSKLPPKYRYSSGLNHPNGYKFKRLFPTSKMMFFDYITHNKKPNKSTEPDYYYNPDY
jgi:hypothetical protein